jgi:hypothetical protein
MAFGQKASIPPSPGLTSPRTCWAETPPRIWSLFAVPPWIWSLFAVPPWTTSASAADDARAVVDDQIQFASHDGVPVERFLVVEQRGRTESRSGTGEADGCEAAEGLSLPVCSSPGSRRGNPPAESNRRIAAGPRYVPPASRRRRNAGRGLLSESVRLAATRLRIRCSSR